MWRGVFLMVLCLLTIFGVQGQQTRRSVRLHRSAVKKYAQWNKQAAYQKLERAIARSSRSPEPYAELGRWYFSQHYFGEAARVFERGYNKCVDGHKRFAHPLALAYIYCGLPRKALEIIDWNANSKDVLLWQQLRDQANFVNRNLSAPVSSMVRQLGAEVNTRMPETYPCIDAKTRTLFFTRRVNYVDEDIFASHYTDTCFQCLSPTDSAHTLAAANTLSNEAATCVSPDGHYLFFSRSDNRSENGWEQGGIDLFMAYREHPDSNWTTPIPFRSTINTPATEGEPSLSAGNRTLYFVSDREGGYGGKDIWITTFESNMWQRPKNAGPNVNTAGDETAPFICNDNATLFFTSDTRMGMGGKDLFKAIRKTDTTFEPAENLGYPINTAYNEECAWIYGSDKLLFATDRWGPAGNFDLCQTTLPLKLQPINTRFVEGYVYDSISKQKLTSAYIYVTRPIRGDTVFTVLSNRGDGSWSVPLKTGNSYAFHTTRIGYTEKDDTLHQLSDTIITPMPFKVSMLATDYKAPINDSFLASIHFEIRKVELTEADIKNIYTALEPFLADATIIIYVNGYTDNTGNPMINEELSTQRANLVAKLIASFGISEQLIIAKGWGEANTIAPNDTEEGQRKNRRVEIWLKRF